MSNLLSLRQINGESPLKFITTSASNKPEALWNFEALSIPFDPSPTAMTSTDVNSAIQEAYIAATSGLTNPLLTDLILANTYVIKAQNGVGILNLRDSSNDYVSLIGGTKRLKFVSDYWGISDTATFTATDNFIQSNIALSTAKWNTTLNILEMRIDGTGIGLSFDKTSQDIITLWGKINAFPVEILSVADNWSSSYTTSLFAKAVSALSTKGVTLDVGVTSSVALGGLGYTVNIDNTAFVSNLAIANGVYSILFANPGILTASSTITLPTNSGILTLRDTLTDTYVARWNNSTGKFVDSSFKDNGTETAVGGSITAGTLLKATATSQTVVYSAIHNVTLGSYVTNCLYAETTGANSTNMALRLNAANASSNYAVYIDAGSVEGQASQWSLGPAGPAIGGTTTVKIAGLAIGGTSNTTMSVAQTNTNNISINTEFSTSGLANYNIGNIITVANAANQNVGMQISATGTDAIGIQIQDGGLLVGVPFYSSYASASVIAQFESSTKAILVTRVVDPSVDITAPINGMITYNTTTNKFMGYENGAWVNLI